MKRSKKPPPGQGNFNFTEPPEPPEPAIPGAEEPYSFDGETYVEERDQARLAAQIHRVFQCMKDGRWRSLQDISTITADPLQSISARLRDLRKERFGAHRVERRYKDAGLFEYRLVLYGPAAGASGSDPSPIRKGPPNGNGPEQLAPCVSTPDDGPQEWREL